jgi:predicted TIM-barrel fold metal-dependent hydrolase
MSMSNNRTKGYATEAELSRRQLLQHMTGAAAAGLAWGATGSVSYATQPAIEPDGKASADPGWIDAHVHVWTTNTSDYPLAAGFRRDQMEPASFEPEVLLAQARPCGVRRIVLIQMSFYGFDNSYMLDMMKRFPGVFSSVAVIDDNEEAQPVDEMRRLAKLGVRGFRIYPRNMSVEHWLDARGMREMWKCGAQEGLAMCHLINPDALPAVDRMCEGFPDTPVVIDHFARVGVDGQIREADVDALCRLARHKNTAVKLSAFYALGRKEPPYLDLVPMIRRLLDAYGPQRLMWATDCPFQVVAQTYSQSIELVRDRCDFLSKEDREWILRRTAERVFFS